MTSPALPSYAQLSGADEAALTELYRRGTPANTLRAWERDLAYIAAWKMAAFGRPLVWPEEEKVALRFVLDHAQDLTDKPGPAQDTAQELIAIGLRLSLACPAPATLDRRIASWQAFHRMRNLISPFSAPLVSQARQKARRANAKPRQPKSPKPVTRAILETLLATCDNSHRGIRDRAMLMLAFASGAASLALPATGPLADLARLVAMLAGSGDASPAALIALGLGLIGLRDRLERGFRGDD